MNHKNKIYAFIQFSMFLIVLVANSASAQNKQQQITERIIIDQKLWQQSKMPTRTIYNNNFTYKVSLFPNEHRSSGRSISHYQNITVPKKEKTNFSIRTNPPLNYPGFKKDSLNNSNKSFLKFSSPAK